MSQNPQAANPVVNMITQVRQRIRKDLYAGQLDYDAAVVTIDRYLGVATKMDDQLLVGQLLETRGTIELERGHFEEGLAFYHEALAAFQDIDDAGRAGVMLNNIGEAYRRRGLLEEALDYYLRARELAIQAERHTLLLTTYNNEGQTRLAMGDVEEGLALLEQALSQAIAGGHYEATTAGQTIPEICSNLARIYAERDDFETAHQHATRALNLAVEYNQVGQQALAYQALALIASRDPTSDDDPTAYYEQSRVNWEKIGGRVELARMLIQQGDYLVANNQADTALEVYQEALTLLESAGLHDEAQALRKRLAARQ